MLWLIFILIIIAIFLGKIVLTNTIKSSIKLCLFIFLDVILLFSILFRHYLVNTLWIFGAIIWIMFLLINIILLFMFFVKYKNKIIFLKLFIPIISIIIYLNNIDDKIALKIELYRAKNMLEKIIDNNNLKAKNVSIYNGLYAFTYYSGIVDNWIAIIYDVSGLLENGLIIINNNKDNYIRLEEYSEIKNLFGGDLYFIKKLEINWYLCYFT
jgi:hypothetical protein